MLAATEDRIVVDDQGRATRLEVSGGFGQGMWHLGMGSGVPVFDGRSCVGFTTYEPFLTVAGLYRDGEPRNRVPYA